MNGYELSVAAHEAKIKTAIEDPDFAERAFKEWRDSRKKSLEIERRDDDSYFVNAWAKVAWLAEGQRDAMGRQLNKLQQRIGRQRVANSRLIWKLKEKDLLIKKMAEENIELHKVLSELEMRLGR